MTKIELEIHDDIVTTINKIKNVNDSGVELIVPENSVLFDSIINLKVIQSYIENLGLNVIFTTSDEVGANLISMLDGNANINDFVESTSGNITEVADFSTPKKGLGLKLPSIALGNFKLRMPRVSLNKKGFLILPILILILLGGYFWISNTRNAYAKIVVESQALTRSLTVKVKTNAETSSSQKILKGYEVSSETEEAASIDTTGEKTVGEKAEGKATIYNKTSDDKEFKKGINLTFDRDAGDLIFITLDEVTAPAAAPEDPLDPSSPLKPGSAEVDIQATDVGETYNIDKDETLEVKGEKKANFEAQVSEELDGGKSEIVKIVSQADITKIKENIANQGKETAESALKRKVTGGQAFIEGSTSIQVTKDTFSHKLDEETDKLTLTQTLKATGLAYARNDLDKLTDELVADLIPEGFELSDEERESKVEVLGNSTSTTLSSTEADIQVTLKTYIVTKIDGDELKERLKGKSFAEGEKILGGVSNIKTYELVINPNIPFFNKVPTDTAKITVEVERE